MRAVGRGLLKFLRIYAAYFLLTSAVVVAGYGIANNGVLGFLIALPFVLILLYLAARAGGIRWPKRG